MIMDSFKNVRWITPFKKFVMVRVKWLQIALKMYVGFIQGRISNKKTVSRLFLYVMNQN